MNEQTKNIVFIAGALLVLISALLYLVNVVYAPYGMAVGAAAVAIVRLSSPYNGNNIRAKRLVRMQLFSSILMIAASSFMFNHRQEWVICLMCAAVFEVYAAFAMPTEKSDK